MISHDYKNVLPHYPLQIGHQYQAEELELYSMFEPIIVNIRDAEFDNETNEPLILKPSDKHARLELTKDELEYFKENGNNATIFIHGYNVPYGEFGKYLESLETFNLYDLKRVSPTSTPLSGERKE